MRQHSNGAWQFTAGRTRNVLCFLMRHSVSSHAPCARGPEYRCRKRKRQDAHGTSAAWWMHLVAWDQGYGMASLRESPRRLGLEELLKACAGARCRWMRNQRWASWLLIVD